MLLIQKDDFGLKATTPSLWCEDTLWSAKVNILIERHPTIRKKVETSSTGRKTMVHS